MSKIIALFIVLCVSVNSFAQVGYTVTDLGALGGSQNSRAYGISGDGQVTGWVDTSGGSDVFLYANGVMNNLGNPLGGFSIAYGVNDGGQVVGYSGSAAFLYSNGVTQNLGTLGGSNSEALGINNSGEIVGDSDTDTNTPTHGATQAFLYANGHMQNLGNLGYNAAYSSYATAINNNGEITGYVYTPGGAHAFLYSNGTMQDLGTLTGTGQSFANAINDNGDVVGYSNIGPGSTGSNQAVLWSNGSIHLLGTLGGTYSMASGINNSGEVVGQSDTESPDGIVHAFLYLDGSMEDLNNLVDPTLDWTLESANAINESGQIVGYGLNPSGQTDAFLLTPVSVPEPATLTILGLSSFLVLKRPRRS